MHSEFNAKSSDDAYSNFKHKTGKR